MVKQKKYANLLKLKIDFEGFKLEVVSNEPSKTLNELNTLIKSKRELIDSIILPRDGLDMYDSFDEEEFNIESDIRRFTKELASNKKSLDTIRDLSLKHKNYIYRSERVDLKKEVDLTNHRFSIIIEKKELNLLIQKLLFDINVSKLKHVFVHVISDNFSKEHQDMLIDEIKRKASFTDTTFLFTPKKLNGVIFAETLFFGDFPYQREE